MAGGLEGLFWLALIVGFLVWIWKTADPGIPSNIWNEGSSTKKAKVKDTERTEEVGVFIFMDGLSGDD